jgi:D-sedoheptulose 7-phosphate isomerase
MSFSRLFLEEVQQIAAALDLDAIERSAEILADTRKNGRLFVLGVGGSAANASHAVNDFRKIAGIEAYAPTDNVAELTARTNDEGWATVFAAWLRGSRLKATDTLLILSVGGGDAERNVSPNLVSAIDYARSVGSRVVGIVGRDGGYTAKVADACVVIPTANPDRVTPHSEAFQAVVWHLLVSHPLLKQAQTKWESMLPQRAVFLDRDGTLTEDRFPPKSVEELRIVPGAAALLANLKEAGYRLIVVTNQPDVGRGLVKRSLVEAVNERLLAELPIDRIYVCYHSDEDGCGCRKPKPGMLALAAEAFNIDLGSSYMVGDYWRDVIAGKAAGCKTVFIESSNETPETTPDATVLSLREAVGWILRGDKP